MVQDAQGPIQTAHSLGQGSVRNSDGSITIRCKLCGYQIGEIDGRNKFHSAICAICEYESRGIIVPKEIEDQLRTMRLPDGKRIPMGSIEPTPIGDPMINNEVKVGRPEYFFRVVRQMVAKTVEAVAPKKKKYKEATAQELADEKRHKPLFQGGVEFNIKRREEK